MSFIRNGYAVRTGCGFLGALFSASLALALFGHGTASAQEVKQIKLTDKHIQGFMAAYEDIAKVYDGAESDKPDRTHDCKRLLCGTLHFLLPGGGHPHMNRREFITLLGGAAVLSGSRRGQSNCFSDLLQRGWGYVTNMLESEFPAHTAIA